MRKRFRLQHVTRRAPRLRSLPFRAMSTVPDEKLTFIDVLGQGWLADAVAEHLGAADALRFARTCRLCRVVRLAPPLPNVTSSGSWQNPPSRYEPHNWQSFDLATASRVHTVYIKCLWRDQGWGNQKGMLSVVGAPSWDAPNDYQPWSKSVRCGREPAPHKEAPLVMHFRPAPDDPRSYNICARAGGGGGHALHVRNLVVRPVVFV